MKRLLILRHADALHTSPSGRDFDRPLSPRGHTQLSRLAAWLNEQGKDVTSPEAILCSPALRTRETLRGLPPTVASAATDFPRDLYSAGPHSMLEAIEVLPANVQTVLVIGHNPTVSTVLSDLVGAAIPLATCTLAAAEIHVDDWRLLRAGRAALTYRVRGETP